MLVNNILYPKIYFRNIFLETLRSILIILISLTCIAIINQVNLVIGSGIKSPELYRDIIKLCLYMTPYFMSIIIPFSIFIGIMMTLYKYQKDKIFISLQNIGLSQKKIHRPFYVLVLFFIFIHYYLYIFIAPHSYDEFKKIQVMLQQKHISSLIEANVIQTYAPGLTIYVHKKSTDELFEGVLISDSRDKNILKTFSASKGKVFMTPENIGFELYDGIYQEIHKNNVTLLTFEKYSLSIQNSVVSSKIVIDSNIMSFNELMSSKDTIARILLHQKILWPLYSMIFAILSLKLHWLFYYENYHRGQGTKSMFIIVGIGMLLAIQNFILQNFSLKHIDIGIVMMYLNSILLLQIALQMLKFIKKHKI